MPSASPSQSSSKPSDRSVLTQQAASVLAQMNVSPMHSPNIIFGHKSGTAFRSNDAATAIVSTVEPRGTSFGSLDTDVVLAGGQTLLLGHFEQLKNLSSCQTAVHSGGPWQKFRSSHIISIIPQRLANANTQSASGVLTDCYTDCLKAADTAHVTTLVFPLLCAGSSR